MSGSLAGRTVLVTRPSGLSDHLAELLRSQECEAIILPAIDILPPDDPASLQAIIRRLDEFDIAIFVSPTAAARASDWRSAGPSPRRTAAPSKPETGKAAAP